ncbi:uncharacterized protein [Pyrus communis]|uniref:uncharacterized protein n=1 Tax=Pyrus communis TaxID=23211 RepID=UPI0035C124A4
MSTSTSNTWLLTLKVALISTGVVSIAVGLKLSAPVVADAVTSHVPSLWSSAVSWLRPPYLYIIINCIIISIVASSKLHPKPEDSTPVTEPELVRVSPVTTAKISAQISPDYSAYDGIFPSESGYDENVLTKVSDSYGGVVVEPMVSEVVKGKEKNSEDLAAIEGGDEAAAVSTPVKTSLQRKDSMEFWLNENQKPPVSARIGHRRSVKAVKASPEGGKSFGVSKPKRNDTLESTWKTITEGRSVPLARHLKKSDTWDTHVQGIDENTPPPMPKMNKSETFQERSSANSPPPNPKMKKSETFQERSSENSPSLARSSGSGRLRKEPSLSQDELNRRVEAFINKFNEEMRLQRQESLNQYQKMVNRGAKAPMAH